MWGDVSLGYTTTRALTTFTVEPRFKIVIFVGKRTLAVIFGRSAVSNLYLFNGYIAVALMGVTWMSMPIWAWAIPILYLIAHTAIWWQLGIRTGARLNPLLGMTAMTMAAYSLAFATIAAVM